MKANQLENIKNSWNEWSETWYQKYRSGEVIARIIQRPESVFHPVTYSVIRKAVPKLLGKRILVPSSGDNHAVFAFHLMGAEEVPTYKWRIQDLMNRINTLIPDNTPLIRSQA